MSIKYGFDEKDLIEYDLKKYLIEKYDEKKRKDEIIKKKRKHIKERNDKKASKNNVENIKEKNIENDNKINEKEEKGNDNKDKEMQKIIQSSREFFEELLFYIGPIQCLIKTKELSKELFDLFEELKNRKEKEWITYKIHKIPEFHVKKTY